MSRLAACLYFFAGAAFSGAVFAGQNAGQFGVNIRLTQTGTGAQQAQGVCISQSLSEQTNALVRVVCSTGQFVMIEANPNRRFLGAHGGAFRFFLNSRVVPEGLQSDRREGLDDFYPGSGTVTALRVYNVSGSNEPLEMLVTF